MVHCHEYFYPHESPVTLSRCKNLMTVSFAMYERHDIISVATALFDFHHCNHVLLTQRGHTAFHSFTLSHFRLPFRFNNFHFDSLVCD